MAGSSSKKGQFPNRRAKKNAELVSRQQVRQMIMSHDFAARELKKYSATVSGTFTSAGALGQITGGIVQGDNVSNRNGYQITLKHLHFRFEALLNTSAATDFVRLIVFHDTQNTNTLPAVTDVLDTAAVLSTYNYAAVISHRFKIHVDQTYPLVTGASNRAIFKTYTVSFRDLPVSYSAATTANGTNALFYLLICDSSVNPASFGVGFEVRFFDA